MESTQCSLCCASVEPRYLERHVRQELGYAAWKCALCRLEFFTRHDAQMHFDEKLGAHAAVLQRIQETLDYELEERVFNILGRKSDSDVPKFHDVSAAEPSPPSPAAVEDAPPATSPPPSPLAQPNHLLLQPKHELGEAAPESEDEVELKPTVRNAAAVSCRKCGLDVIKKCFRHHVLTLHMKTLPYHCKLCDHKTNVKAQTLAHIKKTHPEAGPAESSLNDLSLKLTGLIGRTLADCFGDVSAAANPKKDCRECLIPINSASLHQHVAHKHMKESVFTCRQCDHTTNTWNLKDALRHVKRKHPGAGVEALDDRREELKPLINQLIHGLFD